MKKNLELKNNTDLIYLEGSYFENITSEEMRLIGEMYRKKLNVNKKMLGESPSLYIFDYRPHVIDKDKSLGQACVLLENPAIQPHDSRVNFIKLKDNNLRLDGFGNSYMNYEDYEFQIDFNLLGSLSILENKYSEFEKKEALPLSLDEFNARLSRLTFREVFLNKSNTLNDEIHLVFVDDNSEDYMKEERSVIVINFEYDKVKLNSQPISKKNTKKM